MAPVGAVAKIGQSLSKGALALSFDDKFIEAKNFSENRNKPKSIGDGMKKGLSSAGSSIYSGFTGIFTTPMEGARNNGIIGFFKGGAKGAAGFVTKTTSGVIDIIAKTSEGLDNQSKSQLSKFQTLRIRRPRPFYTAQNIIKPYNDFHSFWISMIAQYNDQLDMQRIYEIFLINEDVKSYHDQEIDQTLLAGMGKDNILNFKEEEHKSSIFAITKTQIIEVTSVVQLLRSLGSVQDRINQGNQEQHGTDGKPLDTDCYDNLLDQQEDDMKEIVKKKNQLLISNVFKIINIVNIEVTGDAQSLLVIKFLNPSASDDAVDSEFTRTPNEALNPRMQQALNTKQSIAATAAAEKDDAAEDRPSQPQESQNSQRGAQSASAAGLRRVSMHNPIQFQRANFDIHARPSQGAHSHRTSSPRQSPSSPSLHQPRPAPQPPATLTQAEIFDPRKTPANLPSSQNPQILHKVKEQLILKNFHSSQRVFSSADYLQIDFDSPQRAKEVMAAINKIRLLLTREMMS